MKISESKTQELALILKELIILLNKHGINNWADWMTKALNKLENSDFHGISHLLSAYGGMGSFNDLSIEHHESQHPKGTTISQDNAQLRDLSSRAYSLAADIKRENESQ